MRAFLPVLLIAAILWSCEDKPNADGGTETVVEMQTTNPLDSLTQLIEQNPNDADLYHTRGVMLLMFSSFEICMVHSH